MSGATTEAAKYPLRHRRRVTPRATFALGLLALFALPPAACAGYALAVTSGNYLYLLRLTDNFATAALIAFLGLLVLAFVAGPTRIDMTMIGTPGAAARQPHAMVRQYTGGRVDLSHLSFPLQVLAGIAAVSILLEGIAVSSLA